jgi:hypothetical protein
MSEIIDNSDVVNLEEVSSTGRPFLKSGTYSIRCIKCEKQKSKKQNDMLVFEWEICSPKAVKVTGENGIEKDIPITGFKLTDWIVFNDMGLAKFKSFHKAGNFPMTLSKKNPNTKQYLGKCMKVTLRTEPTVLKDENTGEPIVDDAGNTQSMNNYRLDRFLGSDDEFTIPADNVAF